MKVRARVEKCLNIQSCGKHRVLAQNPIQSLLPQLPLEQKKEKRSKHEYMNALEIDLSFF